MTLASGADVKIGSYEFMLDDTQTEPYAQVLESLYSDTTQVYGRDAQTANPSVLLWTMDDWAGGSETKYFNKLIPDTYWYGKANPRIRGSVQSVPTQAQTTVTLTTGSPTEWHTTQVAGKIWAGANRDVFYSSDNGVTWSQHNSTALFAAGMHVDGMSNDGNLPWVSASDGTTRRVLRIDSTTASTVAVSDVTTAKRTYGMATLEGKVYLWTGGSLIEYNTLSTLPITHTDTASGTTTANKVHQPFSETPSGTFYAGVTQTDNSIVYFISGGGQTFVFEYKYNAAINLFVGRPIWQPGLGFTARKLTYSQGIIYLLGEYGDQVALYGMSLTDRNPYLLSYVGQQYGGNGTTLTPRALAPSYGSQVVLAIDDGTTSYHFVYDAETDSLTELDQRTISADGTVYAMATVGTRRLNFANKADTTGRINRWNQDYDTPAGAFQLISSAWDFDYPIDEKLLFGFEVVQDPSIAAATVQIEYQRDEDGTWTNVGTTSAGVKYTTFDISANNIKFRILRVRITGANGARVFAVNTRTYINSYQRLWRLVLKLKRGIHRPRNQPAKAETQRDYLLTLATTKSSVTFLDGRRYPRRGGSGVGYTSHTVVVEFPRDGGIVTKSADEHFEGVAYVTLRQTS